MDEKEQLAAEMLELEARVNDLLERADSLGLRYDAFCKATGDWFPLGKPNPDSWGTGRFYIRLWEPELREVTIARPRRDYLAHPDKRT